MKKTTKWAIALAAVLAAGGLTFGVPALAQGIGFQPRTATGSGMMAMHDAMAPLMSQMPAVHEQAMGEVAQLLGMTVDELNDALADRSLAEVATEKGIALDEVQKAMTDRMKTFLDQAVADGTLTREQADQMMQHHAQNSESCHEGGSGGTMGGMMGHMGHMGQMTPRPSGKQ